MLHSSCTYYGSVRELGDACTGASAEVFCSSIDLVLAVVLLAPNLMCYHPMMSTVSCEGFDTSSVCVYRVKAVSRANVLMWLLLLGG